MKLLREISENIQCDVITEETTVGPAKRLFIRGVFAQAERKNGNGRIYPSRILHEQVDAYSKSFIESKRSMGELGHPNTPQINLDRASHLITSLRMSGNDAIGEAKILNTPCGKIAQGLLEDGVKLGVSTRGCGSITSKSGVDYVNSDFRLATVDIVADPSAPHAFVDALMESREWVMQDGVWIEKDCEQMKDAIRRAPSRKLTEVKIAAFQAFMEYMSKSS
jgi:hypothetical protein